MISIHANSAFSDELTRLGVLSLEEIYGESFEPFSYERLNGAAPEAQPDASSQNFAANVALDNFQDRVVELQPICDGSTVAAVDVSSRSIGWTSRGIVYALRGTIAWREEYAYRYLRCGPFLLHLKNTDFAYEASSKRIGDAAEPWGEHRFSTPAGRIQSYLERELQSYVCRSAKDALVLFDGCLAAIPPSGHGALKETLDSAAGNRNAVIAVSKETSLNLFGEKITTLLEGLQSPCLIDLDGLIAEGNRAHRLLGRIFVGKLTHGGYGFRIDVDRHLTPREAAEAVGRLMGSDLVVQGYPETLRLAHILSFFTPTEVIGLQHFLVKNYGLTPAKTQPLRRMLFGPFGRGEGA